MTDGNQHLVNTKESKRLFCSPSECKDAMELKKLSSSPSSKFASSRVLKFRSIGDVTVVELNTRTTSIFLFFTRPKSGRFPFIELAGPTSRFLKADCPTIPISSEVSRFCLKIPNPDQYAIGIGKIPISTRIVILSSNSQNWRNCKSCDQITENF